MAEWTMPERQPSDGPIEVRRVDEKLFVSVDGRTLEMSRFNAARVLSTLALFLKIPIPKSVGKNLILSDGIDRNFRAPAAPPSLPQEEVERLLALELVVNSPQTENFLEAVKLEAAHQVGRWGTEHDAGKAPADWFWLLGYLSGKALASAIVGDVEKAKHHTISSAAALLNWHAALSGERNDMRPGIAPPEGEVSRG